jgi:hypothetical protein
MPERLAGDGQTCVPADHFGRATIEIRTGEILVARTIPFIPAYPAHPP